MSQANMPAADLGASPLEALLEGLGGSGWKAAEPGRGDRIWTAAKRIAKRLLPKEDLFGRTFQLCMAATIASESDWDSLAAIERACEKIAKRRTITTSSSPRKMGTEWLSADRALRASQRLAERAFEAHGPEFARRCSLCNRLLWLSLGQTPNFAALNGAIGCIKGPNHAQALEWTLALFRIHVAAGAPQPIEGLVQTCLMAAHCAGRMEIARFSRPLEEPQKIEAAAWESRWKALLEFPWPEEPLAANPLGRAALASSSEGSYDEDQKDRGSIGWPGFCAATIRSCGRSEGLSLLADQIEARAERRLLEAGLLDTQGGESHGGLRRQRL